MTPSSRLLSRAECEAILRERLSVYRTAGARTPFDSSMVSSWDGTLVWTRNRIRMSVASRGNRIDLQQGTNGVQYDDVSVKAVIDNSVLEKMHTVGHPVVRQVLHVFSPSELPVVNSSVWSDATYELSEEDRIGIAKVLSGLAESKGLYSAGDLSVRAIRRAQLDEQTQKITFQEWTQGSCSMTVRHPRGTGSGWAGLSAVNWNAIDTKRLAERALQKCLASINPVAIEPGRYTVILEPQAVADLTGPIPWTRQDAERNWISSPWSMGYDSTIEMGRSKLGLKVMSEQITIEHDPTDPWTPSLPFPGLQKVTYVKDGVLVALEDGFRSALVERNDNWFHQPRKGFKILGTATADEAIIADAERALLVTRFSKIIINDSVSVLLTGVTRDGLWLVEKGKITKAVKNMRFTESPIFMLNQVEKLGISVPVLNELGEPSGVVVPTIMAKDFSFTSLVDAV